MPASLPESYWPADQRLALREQTIGDLLPEAAASQPDSPALIDGRRMHDSRRVWSYAELLDAAELAAQALLERFAPGDRVAIWAPNCAEWVVLQQGLSLAGMVMVALNPNHRRQELFYVLGQSKAAGVFFAKSYRDFDMAALVEEVVADLPGVRQTISFGQWEDFIDAGRAGNRHAGWVSR